MNKLAVCLWFDGKAREAAEFYCGVFKDAKITSPAPAPGAPPAVTTTWEMNGVSFIGLNGGPMFKFSEAISFSIDCADQAEVDYYWDALRADGGEESQCGWLKDRFGLSWQIVPERLYELVSDPDHARADAANKAMYGMRKIVVADLEAAVAAV